ncbi:MAG: helix-hairpin-helix domain-containing protein, partial [Candidatus Magnetomorum sp.]|nr:helix-hairpin-helix domain-containing protein [Candidatus Magnetomorum sp.]
MNLKLKRVAIVAITMTLMICWIGSAMAADGMIDINTASVAQLTAIPGIGKKIAERIVQYREKNGLYKAI